MLHNGAGKNTTISKQHLIHNPPWTWTTTPRSHHRVPHCMLVRSPKCPWREVKRYSTPSAPVQLTRAHRAHPAPSQLPALTIHT
eukprot:2519372-Pyramimonas_sp.AAC.1